MNVSCCRLCKSVGNTSNWRVLYSKGNRLLLVVAEELYCDANPRSEFLPHLLCRPCERRPNNFSVVKSTISEIRASFKLKVNRCIDETSSAPHTFKKGFFFSGSRSRRRLISFKRHQLEQMSLCSCIATIISRRFSLLVSVKKKLPYSHAVHPRSESVLLMC